MKKVLLFVIIFIIVAVIFFLIKKEEVNQKTHLQPIKSISLTVPEPSGLFFDKTSKTFWTVSDENSTIYNIDSLGNIISEIKVNGKDLEGITKLNDTTLVTILERERTIIFLNINGTELNKINLDLKGEPNKGLEGITYNSTKNELYIINEKDPGLLLTIDSSNSVIKKQELYFTSDYSGLDYVEELDMLWIISDEGNAIMQCTTEGKLIKKFTVDVEQIEGIAVDYENKLIYIISDPLEKMFIYRLP